MTNENIRENSIKRSLKDEFCVWSEIGKTTSDCDVNEEYILPDYLPDIRKLLLVKVKTGNSDLFKEDGRAEITGDITFNVVYLGESGEIKCISQTYPYSSIAAIEGIYDDTVIEENTNIKNRSIRALSPRKLMLKAKVQTDIKAYNKLCVSPRLVGSDGIQDEFTLERNISKIDCINYIQFQENDIRVSEDIEYKGRQPITELICSDVDVFATECRYSDGKLMIKGIANLSCLVCISGDEEVKQYDVVEKTIPVSHSAEISLPAGDWKCRSNFILGGFECSVANDSYGEARTIEVDFSCRADITAMANEESHFTDDVFSTAYEYSNKYMQLYTDRLIKSNSINFSVDSSNEVNKGEGEDYRDVFMSSAEADINAFEIKNGKGVFSGECSVKAVISNTDGGYMNCEFSFPIRYEVALEDSDDDKLYSHTCNCDVIDLKISFDGKKIGVNAEIGLNYAIFEKIFANTVETVSIDKENPLKRPNEKVMILYYPEANETLWSISKKYGISCADLEKANNKLLEDTLPRVMIIPTRIM